MIRFSICAEQQQKQSENNINNTTKGSRAWWQSVKSVTGEKRSDNSQPYQYIDNTWLNCDDFCDKLNNNYVNIAGVVKSSLPNLPSLTEQITTVGVWEVYDMRIRKSTPRSLPTRMTIRSGCRVTMLNYWRNQ